MFLLDMVGDLVDEHARDQRGDRRHQEDAAKHDAEARGDRHDPGEHIERRMECRAEHRFAPAFAISGKEAQQPLQADREHRDQHQRERDRAPQDRAHRRGDDLRKRLDGGVQHGGDTSLGSRER